MATGFLFFPALDCCFLADSIAYFLDNLFQITGFYGTFYKTITGLAQDAVLKNCLDPVKKGSIQLPMLDQRCYEVFSSMLKGGLASVFCSRATFNSGLDMRDPLLTHSAYLDANGLYAGILSAPGVPHSNFTYFSPQHDSTLFNFLCSKLTAMDVGFFKLMMSKNTNYVFKVVLTYDLQTAIHTNAEFCNLPYLKAVDESMVSAEQVASANRMGRRINKEKPKLVTSLEKDLEYSDFVQNILC